MRKFREQAEITTAALLHLLAAREGKIDARAVADILEQTLYQAAQEHERHELQRVAEVQESAHVHLTRLLNASPAVIYCRSASGDYQPTFVSDSISRLFGCTPREYLNPDDVPRINAWVDVMFENDTRSIEYRIRRDDGSYFWVHDRQQVVRDKNGEPIEIAGSWTDITERKEAEEAREKARKQLDQLLCATPPSLSIALRRAAISLPPSSAQASSKCSATSLENIWRMPISGEAACTQTTSPTSRQNRSSCSARASTSSSIVFAARTAPIAG
jgi:adenylate cyclase